MDVVKCIISRSMQVHPMPRIQRKIHLGYKISFTSAALFTGQEQLPYENGRLLFPLTTATGPSKVAEAVTAEREKILHT